ncbi:iron-sulfur cluster assembly accessory protein [Bradyrhizobium sp. LM4.3]
MTTDVTISDKAARRIGEILKGEGSGAMLRISVEGGGCSGFQYKFDIDRARTDDDLVIEQDNAVVLVDSASQPFLAGSQVDFVDDLIGAVVPRQQSERHRVLRLRDQLLDLTSPAMRR